MSLQLGQVDIQKYKRRRQTKELILTILHQLFLTVLALIWLIPIVWLIANSFSTAQGVNIRQFFPEEWTLENYRVLFLEPDTVANFPRWFMNTLLVAVFACLISTLFVLMVSYATSRMRFKSRKPLMNVGIILGLFPGVLSMIAVYFILKSLGLTDSLLALIIVYSASSGLGYLVAKGFFDTIPKSLDEAARIDGARQIDVFRHVILPLSKPIIVYTALVSFLAPWMDFVFARIIMTSRDTNKYTVAIGLFNMLDRNLINSYFAIFCAAAVIVSIPISLLFIIMQRFYVEGVTGGSVKG